MLGDISGQIGVTRIGRQHMHEMCDRFGAQVVVESMEAMIAASGEEFKAALKDIPNGTSEAVGYLDHDGVDVDRKVKLHVRLTVADGKLHFDFTGCDPQTAGPVNLRIGMVEAAVYFCMIGMIDSNLRYSDSIRDQVTFKFAERSVVSAEPPRPCSSYMKCCLKLCDVILEAMDPLLPGRAIAHSGRQRRLDHHRVERQYAAETRQSVRNLRVGLRRRRRGGWRLRRKRPARQSILCTGGNHRGRVPLPYP